MIKSNATSGGVADPEKPAPHGRAPVEGPGAELAGGVADAVGDHAVDIAAGTEPAAPVDPEGHADAKAVFAAAMERKKSAGQSRSAHLEGHGKASSAAANHKTSRMFRRKSG